MKFSGVFGEAMRNVRSGTSRPFALGMVIAAIATLLAGADLGTIAAIQRQGIAYHEAGASIQVVSAPGGIDGRSCVALAQLTGVVAAGALRSADSVTPSTLPSTSISNYEVTRSLLKMLDLSGGVRAGVYLEQSLGSALGVHPGSILHTRVLSADVAGTFNYPDDGRNPQLANAMLSPVTASKTFDECWVDVWPSNPDLNLIGRLTVDPSVRSDSVKYSSLNGTFGTQFPGAQLFDDRFTRFSPGVAFIAATLIGMMAVRRRRLELARAQHLGVPASLQSMQLLIEALTWLLPASILSLATLAVLAVRLEPLNWLVDLGVCGLAVLAVILGFLLGTGLSAALVREKHLFRYFQQRS